MFNPSKMDCGAGFIAAPSAAVAIGAADDDDDDDDASALPPPSVTVAALPTLGEMKPNADFARPESDDATTTTSLFPPAVAVAPPDDGAPMEDCRNEKPLLEDCAGAGAAGGADAVSSFDCPLIDRPPNMVAWLYY